MDALLLSRLQFAITVFYHFLFVPLTIGLVIFCAYVEIQHVRTKNPLYRQMADFWGKLFSINVVLGIVTGITMEFQFGTNWSEYSKYMGDIFGSPLAIEALVAFFLESTFLGVWLFGRNKFSPKVRATAMVLVAIGTNLSALWIITANGFMQNPVGYEIVNGKLVMDDFFALMTNGYAWRIFFHTVIGSYIFGAFFVLAVSAYHLLRKQYMELFMKSFKIGIIFAVFAATATPIIGHFFGNYTAKQNPAKAAAMEAVWETGEGIGMPLLIIPHEKEEKNTEILVLPKVGSLLFTNDPNGKVIGLKDIPKEERPPVAMVHFAFRTMVILGTLFMALAWLGAYLYKTGRLLQKKWSWYLKVLIPSVVLPVICINAGWIVTEVGRQPWTVVGLLKTADSVSPIPASQVWFSLGSLVVFYTVLLIMDTYLMVKFAKKGPEIHTTEEGVDHVA
ncbi:MAG: cytochrome d ubiquinol oxidase subunit [Bacillales bacterium]|nr:cytochrome d ubiquinol oxidase subunit [Bacillales bacterium]